MDTPTCDVIKTQEKADFQMACNGYHTQTYNMGPSGTVELLGEGDDRHDDERKRNF